jgi:hypothetical protein
MWFVTFLALSSVFDHLSPITTGLLLAVLERKNYIPLYGHHSILVTFFKQSYDLSLLSVYLLTMWSCCNIIDSIYQWYENINNLMSIEHHIIFAIGLGACATNLSVQTKFEDITETFIELWKLFITFSYLVCWWKYFGGGGRLGVDGMYY